jgi:ABC-type nickel/cobalt efflux system permease component RcnA
MQLKAYRPFMIVLAIGIGLWLVLPWDKMLRWAASEQREFQNAMAQALRSVRAGEPAALLTLCSATAGYGVVHAIGPGHGKVLIGGAALASGATFRRLASLTILSSLVQAGTAILLVGLLVFALRLNARDAADLTETWLAPLSAVAIALIGFVLVLRGLLALHRRRGGAKGDATHDHDHKACGCGHAHGPTVDEVHSLNSRREALAIVASIAIRPCTGALFVLVIAARFDAFGAGVLAVLAMALGAAATTLTVAAGGRLARLFIVMGQSSGSAQALNLSAILHVVGGGLILGLSVLFLAPYLT